MLLRVCQLETQQGTVWFGSHQRLATCSYSRTTKSRRRNRPKRDTSTKLVDELQTNKRRKVVCEFYESDTEKAYVDGLDLIYSVSFYPACPQFYGIFLTHFASLDTHEPLLYRSALTSNFIDIWNSVDRSSSLLPLFLRLLPDFHLHRHRHYHCLMNPYHPCRRLFYALISLASRCTIHLPRHFHPPHLLSTITENLPLLRVQTLFMT